MDALSDILTNARVRGSVFCRAQLRRPWALVTRGDGSSIFHVIVQGSGWVIVEGHEPVAYRAGDLVLIPHGHAHVMADHPESVPTPIADLDAPPGEDGLPCVSHGGDGALTSILCGRLEFDAIGSELLLPQLPPLIHIESGSGATAGWLDTTLRVLADEMAAARPGSQLLVARLADVMLVQVLREWASSEGARSGAGVLAGLADPQLARALDRVHEDPARPWTAADLARCAGLSRSAFFTRFQAAVGEPPSAYLTRWRMALAKNELERGNASVASVAEQVGYGSEAAFSRAFKRHVGISPAAWKRSGAAAPSQAG